MPFKEPEFVKTMSKYGPKMSSNIDEVEQTTALASGRKPREREEMMGQNLLAMAGRSDARKKNEALMQEAQELADQYKREASRGVSDASSGSSSISDKIRSALGFKHGGKISTAKTNKNQPGW